MRLITLIAALVMASPLWAFTMGDDGLHKTEWMHDTFKDLREDLAEANAEDRINAYLGLAGQLELTGDEATGVRILRRALEAGVQPLLAGMRAPRNLGSESYSKFDRSYVELARQQGSSRYVRAGHDTAGPKAGARRTGRKCRHSGRAQHRVHDPGGCADRYRAHCRARR